MSYYLVFDTETTGLPKMAGWNQYFSSKRHTDKYDTSRVIQLAWSVHDSETHDIISESSYYINQEGRSIPEGSTKIHGITDDVCEQKGLPFEEVFGLFIADVKTSSLLIAHNISFDYNVILSELYRRTMDSEILDFVALDKTCTLRMKKRKPKKLTLMYKSFFGEDFENAHDALADVRATAKCFAHMKDKLQYPVEYL